MSDFVQIYIINKNNFRNKKYPKTWKDPENILEVGPRSRKMFIDNPFSVNDQEPVQVVALINNIVVGRINVFYGQLLLNNKPFQVLWQSGLLISPNYRGKGIGTLLLKKITQLHHTCAGCGISGISIRIDKKLNKVMFQLPRYILLYSSSNIVKKYIKISILASLLTFIFDIIFSIHVKILFFLNHFQLKKFNIQFVSEIPKELNTLINTHKKPIQINRTSESINWVLNNSKGLDEYNNQRLYLVQNNKDQVIAYFIIKKKFYVKASQKNFKNILLGSLKEWNIFHENQIDLFYLILLATKELLLWGVDAVEICVSEHDLNKFKLLRNGFIRVGSLYFDFYASEDSPLRRNSEFFLKQNWRITPFESDNFYL